MPLDAAMRLPFSLKFEIVQLWRRPLLRLAFAWLTLILLFATDWADMAEQWWNSSTYTHILLVPPILVWLVKLRSSQLAKLVPAAWWPGLIIMAGAGFLWLLGDVSGLNFASQLAAVVMLQAAVLTLMGPKVSAGLLFPLAYMLFLVPFGDELVPPLQMVTASLTIGLTHWSGIPAVIDGVFINTPVGLFEVAEACSGVKFLVAMAALGTLVAHVCFRSWSRRIAFMAVAIVLPILANGVRAWGTIYIAQSQGIEFAAGFDHIFYGWIFFALVMVMLLAIGWRWFDRSPEDPAIDAEVLAGSAWLTKLEGFSIRPWIAFVAILGIAGGVLAWSAMAREVRAPMPKMILLPPVEGWQRSDFTPRLWWQPRATGADHTLLGSYQDTNGNKIDVFFGLYHSQEEGRDATGFGEGALVPATDWRWLSPGPAIAGGMSDRLQATSDLRRLALTFYRTGNMVGGSKTQLKLANMAGRLTFQEQPTMMLILSAEEVPGTDAADTITRFIQSTGPLGEWMDRIAQKP